MADPQPQPAGKAPLGSSIPLTAPLYQSSVYCIPDLDTLDAIVNAEQSGFIYARDGHPNGRQLADQLTALESAQWSVVCGSGMAAISAALLAVAHQGERIVASSSLYGRSTQLLNQELVHFGIETTFVDTRDLNQVETALEKPAKVLLVETMSNPLLALCDIQALAEMAHRRGCLLLVDNTFATPVLTRPLQLGADLVMESLTKMISGHGDVTLGVIAGTGDHHQQINQVVIIWGFAANPFDCWLTTRGLATLPLRMRAASANAALLADWLVDQNGVTRVIYPGRIDHPDHELAKRILRGGFGNMISFELEGGRAAVNQFMRSAPDIPFSPSLGNVTTTCSHPGTTSHRYVSPAEKKRQGITDGVIRLSVGVEDLEQIKAAMAAGLL
jgi:cystathionine beta-lyase/cystathionine gamma-synthase